MDYNRRENKKKIFIYIYTIKKKLIIIKKKYERKNAIEASIIIIIIRTNYKNSHPVYTTLMKRLNKLTDPSIFYTLLIIFFSLIYITIE